ncbi:hypothetical protein [Streptomyces sp. NBC_01176]|uniref:hypothetical protein n=1 Tax=Streptomyces sp. NBC_01176 TaxID=2903760 RepID=UPI0038708CF5|nr:hypothetical protein OG199_42510 [Streptomyces sp. NBC_01176]
MVPLSDRKTLPAETRINPNDGLVRFRNAMMSEVLLRVDDDPVAAVAALLDKADAELDEFFRAFMHWARERLARRAADA